MWIAFSVLRRTFIVAGYKPAHFATQWLGKSPSAAFGVLGAFLFSGILHEACELDRYIPTFRVALADKQHAQALYFASNELSLDKRLPSVRFFLLQGLGLVAEQAFTKTTGKKVGGIAGRIWLLLALGQPGAEMVEAWSVRSSGCRTHVYADSMTCRLGRGLFNNQAPPHTWVSSRV